MRATVTCALVVVALAAVAARSTQQPSPAPATQSAQPRDPLAPTSSAEGAAIGPLHTVTISTGDLAGHTRLFVDALGMRVRGPVALPERVLQIQRTLWGIPEGQRWALYLLDRPAAPGAIQIRLLVFDDPSPTIRHTWDPKEPGPLTLGFPTSHLPPLDAALRARGFESLAPMETSSIKRPDGTSYGLQETVFKGPDKVHAVLVSRLDDMPQLGPVDPASGHGGPAYSAQVVTGSDAMVRFYCDVLGLELRSDREWKSGDRGALGIPAGTPFRLALVYAPGTSSGQLLLMDFRDGTAQESGVSPRPPHRGLGMYTFPVTSLDATAEKVRAAGVTIIGAPVGYDSAELGPHRAMTVLAPNGMLIELFERQ
jgi:catechol 2,3-dioxygenase-like lactoylglutathione lyase family enzyme